MSLAWLTLGGGGCGTTGKKEQPRTDAGDAAVNEDASRLADASSDVGDLAVADAGAEAAPDATVDAPSVTDVRAEADAGLDAASEVSVDAGPDGGAADVSDLEVAASCDAGVVTSSHLVFQFDSKNAEWVKSLQWRDSAGTLTANLVGYGGGPGCTAPYEFFGQAFAAPEGNGPYPVGGNNVTALQTCGTDVTIVSQPLDCANAAQTPVTTVYHFYDGARADQVRITRTIGFDASTPKSPGAGMRVYVPRLVVGTFPNVLIPNGAGTAVATASAPACGGDCFTAVGTSWNGKWFADEDPTSGRAMIVLRDPSMTSAVSLTVNNDSNSGSNLASFVVLQPTDGWKAPLTEIEYLCFVDLTTWPQAARTAATLPAGCGPPP